MLGYQEFPAIITALVTTLSEADGLSGVTMVDGPRTPRRARGGGRGRPGGVLRDDRVPRHRAQRSGGADRRPSPEGDAENASWNADTFPFALFFASAEGEDMTEEDWRRLLEHDVSHGEKLEMLLLAQSVNVRAPSPRIPKD
ncbi:hypothetical protein DFP74_3261 [Nocardiopsis sp. Huas11]|nr:hypothetical protein DFP74_3261 [Nocardiopsis sp. Huas11]